MTQAFADAPAAAAGPEVQHPDAYRRLDDGAPSDVEAQCSKCSCQTIWQGSWAIVVSVAIIVAVVTVATPAGSDMGARMQDLWRPLPIRASSSMVAAPCGVNVILARHCNKQPPWAEHPTPRQLCTETGMLRGENMARIFGTGGRLPQPTRLFARKLPEGTYSSRDTYLLWPVAQRYGVQVNTSFAAEEMMGLARSLLEERHTMCGGTILVSWDHCSIPALAQALGCRDERCLNCWDDRDYDTMLWLRFDAASHQSWNLSLKIAHERFGGFDGPSSYRECIGNPVEGSTFGLPCKRNEAWRAE